MSSRAESMNSTAGQIGEQMKRNKGTKRQRKKYLQLKIWRPAIEGVMD